MCGIAGFFTTRKNLVSERVVGRMCKALSHRGPDDEGFFIDQDVGIALGHRRLALLDLSSAGHQPMHSHNERFVLSFNGEIYNFESLKAELESEAGLLQWRGHSDTEILLEAIAHWGLVKTLPKLNGMFALSVWDRKLHKLFLARDRFGEKPLYYGKSTGGFVFGSELKALRQFPGFDAAINRKALAGFLAGGYVAAPESIYEGFYKLPPACWLEVCDGDGDIPVAQKFWDITTAYRDGLLNPAKANPEDLRDKLDTLLSDAVALRMVADVPVGAFLSGGYDSSLIVALMGKSSSQRVRSFSIGFEEAGFDEAPYAKAVADYLGTEHTELYISKREILDVVPQLPEIWDEPFGDSSQIPTYLVSQLTRQHVTASLSGDAADELFGGYNRYRSTPKTWAELTKWPVGMRQAMGKAIGLFGSALPARVERFGEIVGFDRAEEFYDYKMRHWKSLDGVLAGDPELPVAETFGLTGVGVADQVMHSDFLDYLPDDILAKVDRATMAVSLESRIPFLDPAIFDFAARLPLDMKIRNGNGKWLLRQVAHRHIPSDLLERPKQGFSVPIEHWLRGPLKDWAESFLNEKALREQGFFNPAPIRTMWDLHQSGRRRFHKPLWDVLMFQSWLEAA